MRVEDPEKREWCGRRVVERLPPIPISHKKDLKNLMV
jgi:hypothetical protein